MKPVPIAVACDVPMFGVGLQAILAEAGFAPERPTNPLDWARSKVATGHAAALVALIRPGRATQVLGPFAHLHGIAVLALTHSPSPAVQFAAIAAGACGAIYWSAHPREILVALEAAVAGMAILPVSFVRQLAPRDGLWTATDEQLTCLQLLDAGAPVRTIAGTLHVSEREAFRRLHTLYRCLGAADRRAALRQAAELGLV
jgi:DNA-binding NarL/FixJ family response regulator